MSGNTNLCVVSSEHGVCSVLFSLNASLPVDSKPINHDHSNRRNTEFKNLKKIFRNSHH